MSGVNDIRKSFLDFFARNDHAVVASSPLVPRNDPTLMFTNAGMVQFKNVFTGLETRPYNRAVTAQKCVRAGGKHNDLDNVGYTARHHTFFEMLGNFSFGDYFKERAIELAWNLITKEFGLPQGAPARHRLYRRRRRLQSVEEGRRPAGQQDPAHRRLRQFLGHGRDRPLRTVLGNLLRPRRPHSRRPARLAGAGRRPLHRDLEPGVHAVRAAAEGGARVDLPRPSIDTGMGLERIAAVLQGTHDNYSIDLFATLDPRHRRADRRRRRGPAEGLAPGDRRSPARLVVPHRRRRAALERRPRLCAPPHHAPRHAPRRTARRQGTADVQAGAGAHPRDGPGLSRAASAPRR